MDPIDRDKEVVGGEQVDGLEDDIDESFIVKEDAPDLVLATCAIIYFKIVSVIETAWWCVHKKTVKGFSNSKFKSADGTFKITPKLFLSSNDLYGPNWGCLCDLYDGCHDKE